MVHFAQHKKPHSQEEEEFFLGYGEILLVCTYVCVHVYKFRYILLEWSICVGTAYSTGLEGPWSFAVVA